MGSASGGQLRDEARSYLTPYVEQAREMGIKAEGIAVSGSPANAIIRVAHEKPESIVVMTSHGLSGFHRWILGSVTDKVIRSAECPVLVVAVKNSES
jgi:nucleotide-binding universal stress UspA family protein